MHDVVRLVGELVGRFVGDEHALDWVQVDEAHVSGQSGAVHFVQVTLQTSHRVESPVKVMFTRTPRLQDLPCPFNVLKAPHLLGDDVAEAVAGEHLRRLLLLEPHNLLRVAQIA